MAEMKELLVLGAITGIVSVFKPIERIPIPLVQQNAWLVELGLGAAMTGAGFLKKNKWVKVIGGGILVAGMIHAIEKFVPQVI